MTIKIKLSNKSPLKLLSNFKMKAQKKKSISQLEKEERILSVGIYTLLIIITVSLMLDCFQCTLNRVKS